MKERIANISKALKNWKGKRTKPVRILLDPTDRCNLNCLFCWRNDSNQVKEEIGDERLLNLADEAAALGVKEWVISGGGDPFARKQLMNKLIKKIKQNDMWGQVITNGALFSEKDIKDIVKAEWDQVQISIDGPRKVHDFLRGKKGVFDKAINSINLFNKYKEEFNKKKPKIGFNVVLCNRNYKYISYLIKLAFKLGCNQVWFEMIAPWSKEAEKLQFSEEETKRLNSFIKKGKLLAEKLNIWTNIHYYLNYLKVKTEQEKNAENALNSEIPYCLAPWFSIKIHPTGAVGPCCSFYRHEALGNIKEQSLGEIWNNGFDKLRNAILKNDLPDYCKECTEGQKRELEEIKTMI